MIALVRRGDERRAVRVEPVGGHDAAESLDAVMLAMPVGIDDEQPAFAEIEADRGIGPFLPPLADLRLGGCRDLAPLDERHRLLRLVAASMAGEH